MADHVEVVDVAVPVEGVVPVETGEVGCHAGRYEIVDAGAPPVAVPVGVRHGVPHTSSTTILIYQHSLLSTQPTNQTAAGTSHHRLPLFITTRIVLISLPGSPRLWDCMS